MKLLQCKNVRQGKGIYNNYFVLLIELSVLGKWKTQYREKYFQSIDLFHDNVLLLFPGGRVAAATEASPQIEAYLWSNQISMMVLFCGSKSQPLPVNYFRKKRVLNMPLYIGALKNSFSENFRKFSQSHLNEAISIKTTG